MCTGRCPLLTPEDFLQIFQQALRESMGTRSTESWHPYDEQGDAVDEEFFACLANDLLGPTEEKQLILHLKGCPFCLRTFFEEVSARAIQFVPKSDFLRRLGQAIAPDEE